MPAHRGFPTSNRLNLSFVKFAATDKLWSKSQALEMLVPHHDSKKILLTDFSAAECNRSFQDSLWKVMCRGCVWGNPRMWSILSDAASRTLLYTTLTYNVGAWALTSRNWYVGLKGDCGISGIFLCRGHSRTVTCVILLVFRWILN